MKQTRRFFGIFSGTLILLLVIGFLDYLTGEVSLALFYLIPIWIAAWRLGMGSAILFALTAAVMRSVADRGHHYSHWMLLYWNTGIRFGFFLVVGVSLARLKRALDDQRGLIIELKQTFADGWEIGRLFPLCAGCKKVRTDAAYIEEVRLFAEKHPNARFVHGICPECLDASKRESERLTTQMAKPV